MPLCRSSSSFAFWKFLGFFQIFSISGWLNPQIWNSQIQRANCISKLHTNQLNCKSYVLSFQEPKFIPLFHLLFSHLNFFSSFYTLFYPPLTTTPNLDANQKRYWNGGGGCRGGTHGRLMSRSVAQIKVYFRNIIFLNLWRVYWGRKEARRQMRGETNAEDSPNWAKDLVS